MIITFIIMVAILVLELILHIYGVNKIDRLEKLNKLNDEIIAAYQKELHIKNSDIIRLMNKIADLEFPKKKKVVTKKK